MMMANESKIDRLLSNLDMIQGPTLEFGKDYSIVPF